MAPAQGVPKTWDHIPKGAAQRAFTAGQAGVTRPPVSLRSRPRASWERDPQRRAPSLFWEQDDDRYRRGSAGVLPTSAGGPVASDLCFRQAAAGWWRTLGSSLGTMTAAKPGIESTPCMMHLRRDVRPTPPARIDPNPRDAGARN